MRRWCGALVCALAVMAPASPVSAHAALLGSNPVEGSVLAESPPVAELRFSEEVLGEASTVRLLRLGSAQTDELVLSVVQGGLTVLADLPTLERGAYLLQYVVVDPADLHKTVGTISFGIGVAAPPSVSGEQVDGSWLSTALRAVTDAALLLAVGAVVIIALLVRGGRRDLDQAARLVAVSAGVVAVGWVGLLLADAATVGFQRVRWRSLILSSGPGRRALVGVQLAIGIGWFATMLRKAPGDAQRFVARILLLLAVAFVVTAAFGGHAGIGGSFVVGVAVRAVHVASLCVWIGAVAAMWVLSRRNGELRELWPAVSKLAAIGIAVTGASGLVLSGRVAVTVTALLDTSYGQRIVMKAGLLVALAALGALAARRISRGHDPRRLPFELAAAGLAIVIAAVLASSAPARGEQFLPLPVDDPQVVTSDLDDLTVSASIDPARPGPNLVQVRVLDTRRPSPGQVERVTLRVNGADGAVVAERDGVPVDGLVEWTDLSVPNPGTYRIQVDVTRPAAPVSPFVASWDIDVAPVPRADRVLSTRSWAPVAASLAMAWIVIVAAGWWAISRLSRSDRGVISSDAGDRSFDPIGS